MHKNLVEAFFIPDYLETDVCNEKPDKKPLFLPRMPSVSPEIFFLHQHRLYSYLDDAVWQAESQKNFICNKIQKHNDVEES